MDRTDEILVEALKAALAAGAEQRLFRAGKLEGLFPSRQGAAGDVAAAAVRDGLFEVVRTETRGKTVIDWARITPRGVDHLHEHESPVCALRDLHASLKSGREQLPGWLAGMRATLEALGRQVTEDAARWDARLSALERRVEEGLRRLEAAAPLLPPEVAEDHPWALDALNYLDRRRAGGAGPRCALPELFEAVRRDHADLAVAAFHEGLRALHQRRAVKLCPADDVAEMTQPEFALFDGLAVLYHVER